MNAGRGRAARVTMARWSAARQRRGPAGFFDSHFMWVMWGAMPELPDVEVFRTYMDATALHQTVERTEVREGGELLEDVSPTTFRRHVTGNAFRSSRRHGKLLFAELDSGENVVFHFGMTGFLDYYSDPDDAPDHARVLFHFSDGRRLAYDCQRKFGYVGLTEDRERYLEAKELGPDALRLDSEGFLERLGGRRGRVKPALMNQSALAGVGNVYSDEALYQTGIHPETPVRELSEDELGDLHGTLAHVLRTAIEVRVEDFPSDWLLTRREEGAPCPRCDGEIHRTEVSGRSAYFCPSCQPERGS